MYVASADPVTDRRREPAVAVRRRRSRLDAGGPDGGLRAGLIAGLVMLVPFVLGIAFVLFMIGFGGPAGFGVLAILVLLLGAAYTVGLGVLGGYVGDYIAREL